MASVEETRVVDRWHRSEYGRLTLYGSDESGTPMGVCAQCLKPIEPFGTWKHRFVSEDTGELCLDCARIYFPDQVKCAERAARDHPLSDEEPV